MSGLEQPFYDLPDQRAKNSSHRLGDMVVMMIAASLCGADHLPPRCGQVGYALLHNVIAT